MSWVNATRPMGPTKLKWVREALDAAQIRYRISGESFDQVVVEVAEEHGPKANRILLPIDSLPSEDGMFMTRPGTASPAWWVGATKSFGELAGGLGILANKTLRMISDQVQCRPPGASDYDCPLATGVIEECPRDLWAACEPMTRLQNLFLGIAEVLDTEDEKCLEWARALVCAGREARAQGDHVYWLTFFHVLGEWASEGTLHRLVGIRGQGAEAIVRAVFTDTKTIDGETYPRVINTLNLNPEQARLN